VSAIANSPNRVSAQTQPCLAVLGLLSQE
jgi:hypothetical protein